MKILHTADWHLGHLLYGYDRAEEQEALLSAIVDEVDRRRPDALVVCGDIFDTAQPSAASQAMLGRALMDIYRRCPGVKVVLTAGNHDSASRLDAMADVWRLANVEMVGTRAEADDPRKHIVELPGKGFIVAVPYVNRRFLPDGFFQSLLDAVGSRNADGLPVVLMAHAAVGGSDGGAQTSADGRLIGNVECMGLDTFGSGFDYLALGHIHRMQPAGPRGRYSGAPLAVSFDDDRVHGMLEVSIDAHGAEPSIEFVELPCSRPLVTLPSSGSASWPEALAMLEAFDPQRPAYIRLNVADDGSLPPDARARAVRVCEGKDARFCLVNLQRRKAALEQRERGLSIEQLRAKSPLDIAALYLSRIGVDFDDELKGVLSEAMANVEHNKSTK
ncbi:MAG: exonuclease SbcCD subunit D C-terminal domain-containing protein [Muribaculaceae bacterium]|nr:exonuclease SbcCD subunit D C-terminal domain-containing protein [Muribaculaceae bacterium]